ncbi:MAG TPA: hypothetical protein DEV81_26080, partial [Cyanobacteria bacterium UBA11049]|nr:hypothetical protein [Cyanobacteria bacterium UBA11049]
MATINDNYLKLKAATGYLLKEVRYAWTLGRPAPLTLTALEKRDIFIAQEYPDSFPSPCGE